MADIRTITVGYHRLHDVLALLRESLENEAKGILDPGILEPLTYLEEIERIVADGEYNTIEPS